MIREDDIKDSKNKVHNLVLHCYKQIKYPNRVVMQCFKANSVVVRDKKLIKGERSKKNWFIEVQIDKDTEWPKEDLTQKDIVVNGTIGLKEEDGNLRFGIYADRIDVYSEL